MILRVLLQHRLRVRPGVPHPPSSVSEHCCFTSCCAVLDTASARPRCCKVPTVRVLLRSRAEHAPPGALLESRSEAPSAAGRACAAGRAARLTGQEVGEEQAPVAAGGDLPLRVGLKADGANLSEVT